MTLFQLSYALLWMLALVLALASVVLLYLLAQLQARSGRTGAGFGVKLIGQKLPLISAMDAFSGVIESIPPFGRQSHVVLALSPGCGTCRGLIHELKANRGEDVAGLPLWVLFVGDPERCKAAASDIRPIPVLVQDAGNEETMDLRLAGFPTAFVVDETGVIVDVRHPLSIDDVLAAVNGLKQRDGPEGISRVGPVRQAVEIG